MKSARLLLSLILFCGAGEAAVTEVGRVSAKSLNEPSGLVASSRHPGIYWTHNDGDDGVLYAIHSDGSLVGKIKIRESFNDWEDIAADTEGNLYLADVGNNDRDRKHVTVYRIAEPDPKSGGKLSAAATWRLSFPGKPFNCESLFIHDGFGYVISKVEQGDRAAIYRFSLAPAKKRVPLEHVIELAIEVPVTATDLSGDGKFLAVLTERALNVFQIDGDIKTAALVEPVKFPIPSVPAEGCCFAPDGILMIAESGEILRAAFLASVSSGGTPNPPPARD